MIAASATGAPRAWSGDAVAFAKRDLRVGEKLDGEGGYTVYGKLMPAHSSKARNALPIGLAHHLKIKRPIGVDQILTWDDVEFDAKDPAIAFRKEMEATFS